MQALQLYVTLLHMLYPARSATSVLQCYSKPPFLSSVNNAPLWWGPCSQYGPHRLPNRRGLTSSRNTTNNSRAPSSYVEDFDIFPSSLLYRSASPFQQTPRRSRFQEHVCSAKIQPKFNLSHGWHDWVCDRDKGAQRPPDSCN